MLDYSGIAPAVQCGYVRPLTKACSDCGGGTHLAYNLSFQDAHIMADTFMVTTLETKACRACAKAKRKCGKEIPQCARCGKGGVECTYPPNKPNCFVLLEEDNASFYRNSYQSASLVSSNLQPVAELSNRLAFQPFAVAPAGIRLSSIWFNLPSTWQVTPWPQAAFQSCHGFKLKGLITQIQQWFAQWISTGNNPFIHARLYPHHLPQCVQDAYTALSAYLHRTPENQHLVFQIFEARVTQLLADRDAFSANVNCSISPQRSSTDLVTADPLGHLARVQTLTTYLSVMLFNGDIRLRHVAERHIPVLEAWMQQMAEDARTNHAPNSLIDPLHDDALWHAWVRAESLRRSFLVGRTVLALYEMLKAGKPVAIACKGGMAFTIRKGAWEAKSAAEWEEMAEEMNLGLMQVGDVRRWVQWEGISREQVDSFARVFFEGTFGDDWS